VCHRTRNVRHSRRPHRPGRARPVPGAGVADAGEPHSQSVGAGLDGGPARGGGALAALLAAPGCQRVPLRPPRPRPVLTVSTSTRQAPDTPPGRGYDLPVNCHSLVTPAAPDVPRPYQRLRGHHTARRAGRAKPAAERRRRTGVPPVQRGSVPRGSHPGQPGQRESGRHGLAPCGPDRRRPDRRRGCAHRRLYASDAPTVLAQHPLRWPVPARERRYLTGSCGNRPPQRPKALRHMGRGRRDPAWAVGREATARRVGAARPGHAGDVRPRGRRALGRTGEAGVASRVRQRRPFTPRAAASADAGPDPVRHHGRRACGTRGSDGGTGGGGSSATATPPRPTRPAGSSRRRRSPGGGRER
jgi:hypothetical protein